MTDVFSKPTIKFGTLVVSKAHADGGKTPTIVVLATSPPTVGIVGAEF